MARDKITKESLANYRKITEKAFDIIKKSVIKDKKEEASDSLSKISLAKKRNANCEEEKIFEMVECYLSDSKHFEKEGDLINSFGAIYYAHGWIDCGVRLGIFDVHDDKLFTVRD